MANLDSSVPHKRATSSCTVTDGSANSITLTFVQTDLTWTETGRTGVEARSRGRHESTPVSIETDDGDITGSIAMLVTSWKGSSNVHPYEAFTFSGNAAGWTTTGTGSKKLLQLAYTTNSTTDGGGTQLITFAYCRIDSVEVGDQDGLIMLTVSFTDLENAPTIT